MKYKKYKAYKSYEHCRMGSPRKKNKSDKENTVKNAKFNNWCKKMSGEVKIYNIKDLG